MSTTTIHVTECAVVHRSRMLSKSLVALLLIVLLAANAQAQAADTTALYRAAVRAIQDKHPNRKVVLVGLGRADTLLNRAAGLPVRAKSEARKCTSTTCQLEPGVLLLGLNPPETKGGKTHVMVVVTMGPDSGGIVPRTSITEYAYDIELTKRGSTWVAIARLRYRS
jgi:hypothetical protein